MSALSVADLQDLAALDATFMPDECVVIRPTRTVDSRGVPVDGPPETLYRGACRLSIDQVQPNEVAPIGQLRSERGVTVAVPLGTSADERCQIAATHQLTGQVMTLDVIGPSNEGSYSTHRTVRCRQVV